MKCNVLAATHVGCMTVLTSGARSVSDFVYKGGVLVYFFLLVNRTAILRYSTIKNGQYTFSLFVSLPLFLTAKYREY
jgi:hypothetical protein